MWCNEIHPRVKEIKGYCYKARKVKQYQKIIHKEETKIVYLKFLFYW